MSAADSHPTKSAEEPSAVLRVFCIPELLETILMNLNTKDLLISQRTSCAIRRTIRDSVRLRRKLFLEPDWKLEEKIFDACSDDNQPYRKPENNIWLLRAFPGCYPSVIKAFADADSNVGQGHMPLSDGSEIWASEPWTWDVCISFPAHHKPRSSPAVDYPEASWRNMYLSQPPCTNLHLVRRWQRSIKPAIIRPGGITMGDFFEEVTKDSPECNNQKWHESFISSDRDWHFEGNLRRSTVQK